MIVILRTFRDSVSSENYNLWVVHRQRMLYETPQMYSPQIYVDGGHFESALLDTVPKLPTTSLLLNVLIPGGIVLTSF